MSKAENKEKTIHISHAGIIKYLELRTCNNNGEENLVLNKYGFVCICDGKGKELERHALPIGAKISLKDGARASKGEKIASYNPKVVPILTEKSGFVAYLGRRKGTKEQIPSHITIVNNENKMIAGYFIPSDAIITVSEGEKVEVGSRLAVTILSIEKKKDSVHAITKKEDGPSL